MRKVVHRYTKDDYVFVYQMLRFRSEGWSYVKIGEMFNKHHSTIIHWCKRFNVDIGREYPELIELDFKINKKPIPNWYKYKELIDEPINQGKKSYREYLRESDMKYFYKNKPTI
jgi:IS30 family transposase